MSGRWLRSWAYGLMGALWVCAPGVSRAEKPKSVGFEVTIGGKSTPGVIPGDPLEILAVTGEESSLEGSIFFELSPYRSASVSWPKKFKVEVRLFGEMSIKKSPNRASRRDSGYESSKFFMADCGLLPATEGRWVFDPSDILCQGDFVDGAAVIEVSLSPTPKTSRRAIYFRVKNRRFPIVGSDVGIALTLTQPLSGEGDLKKGFEVNDGLSVYYAVSRLKSHRWRIVTSLAALDHVRAPEGEVEDPEDFELGLGLGALFKSNGFLDTDAGMSLAAGIGYNFMVPNSSDRWYWFFGVGANFGRETK